MIDQYFQSLRSDLAKNTHNKITALVQHLNFHNVIVGVTHFKSDTFSVIINHCQDVVEQGNPMQVILTGSESQNYIEVSYLASSYNEDIHSFPDFQTIKSYPFSWDKLTHLIQFYRTHTY